MRKLIAILVALMMFVLPMAMAETALIISDPALKVQFGQEMNIDLAGLQFVLGAGEADGTPALQLDIYGDGAKLYGVSANIVGKKIVLGFEGVSNTYYAELPEQAESLMNLQMPEIDVEAIMEVIQNSVEMDGNTIRIPYTAVNDILAIVAPAIAELDIPGADLSEIGNIVDQLKASNSGFNIEASYDETGSGANVGVSVYLVESGTASTDALVSMNMVVGSDSFSFDIDVGGQYQLHVGYAGAQFAFTLSGQGMGLEFTCDVSVEDANISFVKLDADNAINAMEISDEESSQLQNELMTAAGPLLGYLQNALSDLAA